MTGQIQLFCRHDKIGAELIGQYGAGSDSIADRAISCPECHRRAFYKEASEIANAHFQLGVRYDLDPRNPVPVCLGELGSNLVNDGEGTVLASVLPDFVVIEI